MIYSVHSAPTVPGVEKMERYIAVRKLRRQSRYQLRLEELRVLKELSGESTVAALCLAFDYGRAKGWQAARAEEASVDKGKSSSQM